MHTQDRVHYDSPQKGTEKTSRKPHRSAEERAWLEIEVGNSVIARGVDYPWFARTIREAFAGHSVKSVLLPGCGCGNVERELVKVGFECVGVDIDAQGVAFARREADRLGLPIEYGLDDFLNGPVTHECDAAALINVPISLQAAPVWYKALRRWLKPGQPAFIVAMEGADAMVPLSSLPSAARPFVYEDQFVWNGCQVSHASNVSYEDHVRMRWEEVTMLYDETGHHIEEVFVSSDTLSLLPPGTAGDIIKECGFSHVELVALRPAYVDPFSTARIYRAVAE